MNLVRRFAPRRFPVLLLIALAMIFVSMPARAALDSDLTGIVTDITSYFGDIKTLIITVVVFGIAVSYAKLVKKK